MMNIACADYILCNIDKHIDRLIDVKGVRQALGSARGFSNRLLELLLDEMPTKDMYQLRNEMKQVDKVMTFCHKPATPMPEDWRVIEKELFYTIAEAAVEQCEFCTKDPQQQRACKLAKALNHVTGPEFEQMLPTCEYFRS